MTLADRGARKPETSDVAPQTVHGSASEADQAASESDQQSSDEDQTFSDADQRASDRDRAIADREAGAAHEAGTASEESHRDRGVSRTEREETSVGRAQTAISRAQTERDRVAAARARADAREQLQIALAEAQFDDLTGAYRRKTGNAELQAEIDRAHRSEGRLVLAFVDVDGLKAHNDREGHDAGDRLLLDVVASMRSRLRSYDPVMRFGGDEFVCLLSDADLDDARSRFEEIQTALGQARPGGSISVGLAQLQSGDTLDELMSRADAALHDAKSRRRHSG